MGDPGTFEERLRSIEAEIGTPAISIEVGNSTPGSTRSSYFGGSPYLSEGSHWPTHPESGHPLVFYFQINFAELWQRLPENGSPLPKQGLLQFFYRSPDDLLTHGFDGENQADVHFVWDAAPALTTTTATQAPAAVSPSPNGLPQAPRTIEFRPAVRGFTRDDLAASGLFSDREMSTWWTERRPLHQLLGDYYPVQYDPRESIPVSPDQGGNKKSWRFWQRNEPEINLDWTLLLQLDNDDALGYSWPNGMLYILIKKSDLEAGDLSNLRFNLQVT